MGRLSTLISAASVLGLTLAWFGCDDSKKPNPAPPSNKRNDAIIASSTGSAPHPVVTPSAPVASAKPHALCAGASLNRAMPTEKLGHAEAPGAPSLGDVIFAEPRALIGFAGPRTIKATIRIELPKGFQTSEFLLEHGFIDRIVKRSDLKSEIARTIDYCGK